MCYKLLKSNELQMTQWGGMIWWGNRILKDWQKKVTNKKHYSKGPSWACYFYTHYIYYNFSPHASHYKHSSG